MIAALLTFSIVAPLLGIMGGYWAGRATWRTTVDNCCPANRCGVCSDCYHGYNGEAGTVRNETAQ